MLIARMLLAVTGGGMALVLAVVVLIYGVYLDAKPGLMDDLPALLLTTALFALLGTVATVSSLARARGWNKAWAWDTALLGAIPLTVFALWAIYG